MVREAQTAKFMNSQTKETINNIFKDQFVKSRVPGLTYGVILDGELVQSGAFGVRNVQDNSAAQPDTVFRIASMTKSFTAMSILKLRDAGKLRLDAAAVDYVPELVALSYPTRDSAPIRVRDLLTMSAGFPQDDPWADRQLDASEEQFSIWLREGISFSNPPAIAYEYSNYGYAILGRIITNVAGISYQRYVTQNILEPLGMISSTFDIDQVDPQRLAMGYRREGLDPKSAYIEQPPLHDGTFASMGGLFTTIPDFAHYISFLLSAFPPRDDNESGPVRRSSAREMQQMARFNTVRSSRATPDAPTQVEVWSYGYGLACGIDSQLGYWVAHGGGLPGYGTYYQMLPERGIGVVAFTNLTYASSRLAVVQTLNVLKSDTTPRRNFRGPATELLAARDTIVQLYAGWDDALAEEMATDTFFLDKAADQRRAEFETLHQRFGTCLSVTDLEPENILRGRWSMECERGRIDAFVTLAPTVPPRVQYLVLTGASPLSSAFQHAVHNLLRLMAAPDRIKFRRLFAPQVRSQPLLSQLEAVRALYGKLQVIRVLEGNGETSASLRLKGNVTEVDITVGFNPQTGRLTEVTFSQPSNIPFVP